MNIWPFRVLCIGLLMLGLNADQAAPNAFQRLQQQIAPLLLLSDSDANYELRSLTFERPEIELIARWQNGERTFPNRTSIMTTFNESTLLIEALPAMNALRAQLAQGHAQAQTRLYLSSGQADLSCWQTAPAAALSTETLCIASAVMESQSTAPHSPAVLLGWLLISLTATGIHTLLQRWRKQARLSELLHDVRLPLANLLLYSRLMQRRPESSERYVSVLQSETGRVNHLVNELADHLNGRSEHTSRVQTVCFRQRLEQQIATCRPRLAAANCSLQISLAGQHISATEPAAFDRILHNLLDNCARHAPGQSVRVTSRDDGNHWIVEVLCSADQAVPEVQPGTGLSSCERLAKQQHWRWSFQVQSNWLVWQLAIPIRQNQPPGVLRV
jgi:signal transduction histidine kinase